MHTHTTPRAATEHPVAARIAELSEEYISADFDRRDAIGREVAALIEGRVFPLGKSG